MQKLLCIFFKSFFVHFVIKFIEKCAKFLNCCVEHLYMFIAGFRKGVQPVFGFAAFLTENLRICSLS